MTQNKFDEKLLKEVFREPLEEKSTPTDEKQSEFIGLKKNTLFK